MSPIDTNRGFMIELNPRIYPHTLAGAAAGMIGVEQRIA
jgi:hypothetical protein